MCRTIFVHMKEVFNKAYVKREHLFIYLVKNYSWKPEKIIIWNHISEF